MSSPILALLGTPIFKSLAVGISASELDEVMEIMKHGDRAIIRRYHLSMKAKLKKINEDDVVKMSKDEYGVVANNLVAFHVTNFLLTGTKIPILRGKKVDEASALLAEEDGAMAVVYGPNADELSAQEKADGGVVVILP